MKGAPCPLRPPSSLLWPHTTPPPPRLPLCRCPHPPPCPELSLSCLLCAHGHPLGPAQASLLPRPHPTQLGPVSSRPEPPTLSPVTPTPPAVRPVPSMSRVQAARTSSHFLRVGRRERPSRGPHFPPSRVLFPVFTLPGWVGSTVGAPGGRAPRPPVHTRPGPAALLASRQGSDRECPPGSCGAGPCLQMPPQRPHSSPFEQNRGTLLQATQGRRARTLSKVGEATAVWWGAPLPRGLKTLTGSGLPEVPQGGSRGREGPAGLRGAGWADAWRLSDSSPGGHHLTRFQLKVRESAPAHSPWGLPLPRQRPKGWTFGVGWGPSVRLIVPFEPQLAGTWAWEAGPGARSDLRPWPCGASVHSLAQCTQSGLRRDGRGPRGPRQPSGLPCPPRPFLPPRSWAVSGWSWGHCGRPWVVAACWLQRKPRPAAPLWAAGQRRDRGLFAVPRARTALSCAPALATPDRSAASPAGGPGDRDREQPSGRNAWLLRVPRFSGSPAPCHH